MSSRTPFKNNIFVSKKGRPQIFFGINIFQAAHALQLALRQWRIAQTVMLTEGQRFAALKMLLFFQKRFNGIARLTAIRVDLVQWEEVVGKNNFGLLIFLGVAPNPSYFFVLIQKSKQKRSRLQIILGRLFCGLHKCFLVLSLFVQRKNQRIGRRKEQLQHLKLWGVAPSPSYFFVLIQKSN
jgi:hypothetical protein